jgi:5'-phosphate synthase pdxT subunit
MILAELDGDIVALRQRNILLTTFHPELTEDSPLTGYFIEMVSDGDTRKPSFKAATRP